MPGFSQEGPQVSSAFPEGGAGDSRRPPGPASGAIDRRARPTTHPSGIRGPRACARWGPGGVLGRWAGQAAGRGQGHTRGFRGHSRGCTGRVEQASGSLSCAGKTPESTAVIGSSARARPKPPPASFARHGHLGLVAYGDTTYSDHAVDTGWRVSDRPGAQPPWTPRHPQPGSSPHKHVRPGRWPSASWAQRDPRNLKEDPRPMRAPLS